MAASVAKSNQALFMSDKDFWDRSALKVPTFYRASREVALVMPSSATTERTFSLLTKGYTAQQKSALEDGPCASVMIRYNNTGENGV